ncbi:MAG: glycosyltransferase [Deltaproteobacteria bacterium]|nr:glycosyltransferase [Deltaproteobacteria bacterium]
MIAIDKLPRLLWSQLPRRVRLSLFTQVTRALMPRTVCAVPAVEPITVIGVLSSTTGLGEGARLNLDALARLGYDIRYFDLAPAFRQQDMAETDWPGSPMTEGPGIALIHVNPHVLPYALCRIGARRLKGKRIIGYWAWELPEIPPAWRQVLDCVDELWVPSVFTANAIRPFTSKAVHVVHHPVALRPPVARTCLRARLGIAPEQFAVLTMFHMGSCFERKNPLDAIRAFRAAFGDREDATLLVKVADAEVQPWAAGQLREMIGNSPNIKVITEKFSRQGIADLIGSADVVLSLHRSEGFGLVMAEAMLLGRSVVATKWSANVEFMDETLSELVPCTMVPANDPQESYLQSHLKWAAPDVAAAAAALRRLHADPVRARHRGRLSSEKVSAVLGLEAFRAAIAPSLFAPKGCCPGP